MRRNQRGYIQPKTNNSAVTPGVDDDAKSISSRVGSAIGSLYGRRNPPSTNAGTVASMGYQNSVDFDAAGIHATLDEIAITIPEKGIVITSTSGQTTTVTRDNFSSLFYLLWTSNCYSSADEIKELKSEVQAINKDPINNTVYQYRLNPAIVHGKTLINLSKKSSKLVSKQATNVLQYITNAIKAGDDIASTVRTMLETIDTDLVSVEEIETEFSNSKDYKKIESELTEGKLDTRTPSYLERIQSLWGSTTPIPNTLSTQPAPKPTITEEQKATANRKREEEKAANRKQELARQQSNAKRQILENFVPKMNGNCYSTNNTKYTQYVQEMNGLLGLVKDHIVEIEDLDTLDAESFASLPEGVLSRGLCRSFVEHYEAVNATIPEKFYEFLNRELVKNIKEKNKQTQRKGKVVRIEENTQSEDSPVVTANQTQTSSVSSSTTTNSTPTIKQIKNLQYYMERKHLLTFDSTNFTFLPTDELEKITSQLDKVTQNQITEDLNALNANIKDIIKVFTQSSPHHSNNKRALFNLTICGDNEELTKAKKQLQSYFTKHNQIPDDFLTYVKTQAVRNLEQENRKKRLSKVLKCGTVGAALTGTAYGVYSLYVYCQEKNEETNAIMEQSYNNLQSLIRNSGICNVVNFVPHLAALTGQNALNKVNDAGERVTKWYVDYTMKENVHNIIVELTSGKIKFSSLSEEDLLQMKDFIKKDVVFAVNLAVALGEKYITWSEFNTSCPPDVVKDAAQRNFDIVINIARAFVDAHITWSEFNTSCPPDIVKDAAKWYIEIVQNIAAALVKNHISYSQFNTSCPPDVVKDAAKRNFHIVINIALALGEKYITWSEFNTSCPPDVVKDAAKRNAEIVQNIAVALGEKYITWSEFNTSCPPDVVKDAAEKNFNVIANLLGTLKERTISVEQFNNSTSLLPVGTIKDIAEKLGVNHLQKAVLDKALRARKQKSDAKGRGRG